MEFPFPPEPVPEKIVIFMDTSAEVQNIKLETNDREPLNSFERLQKIVRMFVNSTVFCCHDHRSMADNRSMVEFAVMAELGGSPSLLGNEYGDCKATVDRVEQLRMQEPAVNDETGDPAAPTLPQLDIGEIIRNLIRDIFIHGSTVVSIPNGEDPPMLYITRLVMFITRSRSAIKLDMNDELKSILGNPNLVVDVLYLHEEPSDENMVLVNWLQLLELNDCQGGRGYILECGPDVTDWHNAYALLLSNSMVRKPLAELKPRKRPKSIALVDCNEKADNSSGDEGGSKENHADLIQI